MIYKGKFPEIKHRFTDDWSYYVTRRLNILSKSGIQGIFLVFAALLLFLNFSTSGVTALGAPLAFMASFIIMGVFGVSINLISMLALIMVLGMLVDDSIIVAEQYYQNVEAGYDKYEAAKKAAIDTIKPITATVLTSCIAFGSMFFMGGIMGKFLWPVPIIIIICLVASLFECFFILPSHLNDFARVPKNHGDHNRWYTPIIKSYGKAIKPFLKHPFMVSFFFIAIFIGSIFIAKSMRFELFPGDDVRTVFLQIKGEVGTPLEETDAAVAKLEKLVMGNLKSDELDQIRSKIGTFLDEKSAKTGNHYGSVIIYLTPPDERKRTTDEIINDLVKRSKPLVPKYQVTVLKRQGGPPKGKAVEIELTGDSLDDLKLLSKKTQKILSETKGVVTTEIDFEEGKKQIIAKVNNSEARRLGISTDLIAMELRKAFSGDSVTEIRESDEDIPIRVYLDEKSRQSVKTLSNLSVLSPRGNRIPISKVVEFKQRPGAFVIRRKDRKRIISVSASLDKKLATPGSITKDLDPKLKELLADYPAVAYNFGGENEDTKESMAALMKAGIISFLCIFFVLVVMFNSIGQPIVIMSVIPMGLIGVILAFKIKGSVLSFMALLGVIGLIGVVVNDSIVLVNFINKKREELNNDLQAVIEACMGRFRPVILTSVTTVAGLLPVAHAGIFGGSVGDPFVKPMAFAFAYGLAFATLITLIFVPANYLIYLKILGFFKNLISRKTDIEDDMDGGLLESEA
jgi:multidrug efflux pump subunit AcrB